LYTWLGGDGERQVKVDRAVNQGGLLDDSDGNVMGARDTGGSHVFSDGKRSIVDW